MVDYFCSLVPDNFYHIYNRGNNGDTLFYRKENYEYFLRKYDEYLSLYVETYSFSLMPNHFHLLVRVKNADEIKRAIANVNERLGAHEKLIDALVPTFTKELTIPEQVVEMFRRFFTSYSKSIAIQEKRTGSLFQRKFKRKLIHTTTYFKNVVYYIHANPQLHGIINNFKLYPWSSYQRMLNDRPTKLQKTEVLEWFDNKENYVYFHNAKHNVINEAFIIED